MKMIPNKDGDLVSQFGNINENDVPLLDILTNLPPQVLNTPHQKNVNKQPY